MDNSENQAFPLLNSAALEALALLKRAIYIYSFDTQHVCWANLDALSFWNADCADELYARPLTPYNHATEARLSEYRDVFSKGARLTESWTFYPKGQASPTICHCSGVSIEGHAEAMLVEIDSPKHFPLPAIELRALEALRLTNLMISLFSIDGRVLMRNPAALACFGKMDETLGKEADHFKSMFDEPAVAEQIRRDSLNQFVIWQTARIAVNDKPLHRLQVSAMRDPATGQPAQLVAQEDISELLRASTQVVASAEALEIVLALDLNPAIIVCIDDSRILRVNTAGEDLFGPFEDLRASARDLFADHATFDHLFAVLQTSQKAKAEADFLTPAGIGFRASVRGARLTYDQHDAAILSITDISELHRTNALLTAELSNERSMSKVRSQLLAIAAHDLRTPLSIIDSSAQYLTRKGPSASPEQIAQRAKQIRVAVRSLLKLFDSTVGRARDRQGLSLSSQSHDLVQIVREVAHTYSELLPGFEPELSLPNRLDIPLDRVMIEQVLGNLLSNSIKFASAQPRVRIWIEEGQDSIRIFVRDWGIGIPETERASIFTEYRRGSNAGAITGTGLGLALVKHALELHRGSIRLVNSQDSGTTFEITLPRS